MTCDYCTGDCPHDSTHEGVIEWYQHYMSIGVDDLIYDYTQHCVFDGREPPMVMEKAVEARKDEIGDAVKEQLL